MKRVLKGSLSIFICLSLILFSCLSVLADEHGGISGSFDGNIWTSEDWSYCFPNVDFSTVGSSYDFFNDRVQEKIKKLYLQNQENQPNTEKLHNEIN